MFAFLDVHPKIGQDESIFTSGKKKHQLIPLARWNNFYMSILFKQFGDKKHQQLL